jgi:hypothetical protein
MSPARVMMINVEIGFAPEMMLLRQTVSTPIPKIGTKAFAVTSIVPVAAGRHTASKNHVMVTFCQEMPEAYI